MILLHKHDKFCSSSMTMKALAAIFHQSRLNTFSWLWRLNTAQYYICIIRKITKILMQRIQLEAAGTVK